jgi:hypothetical protein
MKKNWEEVVKTFGEHLILLAMVYEQCEILQCSL